jgi:predicted nucleotidyltransferase
MAAAPPFDDADRLDRLAAAIDVPGVVSVYATGSRISGEARPDSDIDLYLFHQANLHPEAVRLLLEVVRHLAAPIVFEPFDPEEVQFPGDVDQSNVIVLDVRALNDGHFSPSFAATTIRDGLRILDREPGQRSVLEAKAFADADAAETDDRGYSEPTIVPAP